jgi:hypothetical protein
MVGKAFGLLHRSQCYSKRMMTNESAELGATNPVMQCILHWVKDKSVPCECGTSDSSDAFIVPEKVSKSAGRERLKRESVSPREMLRHNHAQDCQPPKCLSIALPRST